VGNRGRLCGGPLLHALRTTRRPLSACADEQRQAMGVVALLLGECRTEGEAVDVAPRREVRFLPRPGFRNIKASSASLD
jgi:hypothetical protein